MAQAPLSSVTMTMRCSLDQGRFTRATVCVVGLLAAVSVAGCGSGGASPGDGSVGAANQPDAGDVSPSLVDASPRNDGVVTAPDVASSTPDSTGGAPDGGTSTADGAGIMFDAPSAISDGSSAWVEAGTSGSQGCVAIPTSDLQVSASAASGTVVGGNLNALLCPGGASAYVESAGARYDTVPYFMLIEWTLGSGIEDFDFQSPAGASNGELAVMVGLNSVGPGTYSSPGGQDCGSLAFTYYLPVPAGVNCGTGTGPNCPPGCTSACSGFGCTTCTAQQPSVGYTAQGTTDCMGNAQTAIGSWQLSLTSVALGDTGTRSGLSYFTPHGTFTATMVAADGSSDTATLTATF